MSDLLNLTEEQRFRLLVSAVTDYAIYMLDPDGRIATWNPGAERFKGYTADEIIGQHFSRFFTPEDVAADMPGRALRSLLFAKAGSRPRAGACARTGPASGSMR